MKNWRFFSQQKIENATPPGTHWEDDRVGLSESRGTGALDG